MVCVAYFTSYATNNVSAEWVCDSLVSGDNGTMQTKDWLTMTAKGGYECGAFRYAVDGEPKAVVVCHCTHCQRQSGSAFGMSMVIGSDKFHVVQGELASFSRPADSGNTLICYFCPHCGTRIYNQKQGGAAVVILKPGTLDDPKAVTPARQLWASEKQNWVNLLELPSFEQQPG